MFDLFKQEEENQIGLCAKGNCSQCGFFTGFISCDEFDK